jgi:hypothetical protein
VATYRFGSPPPFGTRGAYQRLCDARARLQVAFPDDGTRDIPEVLAVFEAVDSAIVRTRRLLNDDDNTPRDM